MQVKLAGLNFTAVATALPRDKLIISDLYNQYGKKEVDRIVMSTGIHSLGIANAETNASDLCMSAAEYLFNETKIERESIDAIIFISQTPDYKMPATSCILQNKLNLKKGVVAFDINYGCSGYIYGLYQAALLIATKSCQKVLVCAGDTMTRYLHPDDHKVRLLLGDAGSATIIESGNDEWAFDIQTDGGGFDKLIIPKDKEMHDSHLYMDGAAIMEFALTEVHKSFNLVLEQMGWCKNEISHAILHQPNEFMLTYLRKKLQLTKEQVPISVKEYGNTGPASIPLTMCDQFHEVDKFVEKSVLSGFGVGLSWGSIALNLSDSIMYKPIIMC